jgi:class 3 adenylate cyclase/tetratricopeptide (TPR) repeat protein
MGCAACGADNPPGAKFCNGCGVPLSAACVSCGHSNAPGSRFCNECGHALAAESRSSEPVQERVSAPPESYTPRHLADRILASRASLEGERKQVTVLFADVVGSTELIRDLDPEDARTLLEPAVSAMLAAVHRFEGTVCRVMGDGIMALFGAPIAHEDHAARACYAALTMQAAIRQYGDEAREREGVHLLARVGLHSGEVVVGAISNDLHVEYSAIGVTTHLAARMEQLAVPGTIQLTAETLRLAEGLVEVRPLGRIPVKGVAEPAAAFELLGAGPSRRRFQTVAARGLTRFVGRQAELEALERALDLAGAGKGQVVAPVGEPGVGKSRLLYEFVQSHLTRDWLVLESGSVSYGKATLWLPVVDLLKSYCRIEPRDDTRTIREKVTGKLVALDPSLTAILPPILALLDLPVEEPDWGALDPARRRQATLDALRRLLLRESQEQPLLLVFEDLHWIDSETQALLDGLVEALPTARILLLVNYRPEYSHTWGNKSYYTQLRIDPLGQGSAGELLVALFGDDHSVHALASLLIARTEGNPFFLEESVRGLVEAGALAGERGAYRLTRPVEGVEVPATVQAVLAARIDRLPPEDKRLLQTAAVIGKDVPAALLRAIADVSEPDLQAGLSRLQAAELMYAVSLFPELELTFKHALTHEVAYGELLQERRRHLHARIVAAIEALYADRLEEHVERLAGHAVRGQVWEKAFEYSRQAGQRSMGRSNLPDAVRHLEQALLACEQLPRTAERIAQEIDLRFDLRTAFYASEQYDRAMEHVAAADGLARGIGDKRRLGFSMAYRAAYLRVTVHHRQAVEAGLPAVAMARELDDLSLRVAAVIPVCQSLQELAEYDRAKALLRENIAALEGDLARDRFRQWQLPSVSSRGVLGWCLSWQGDFPEAVRHVEDALRIAEEANHPATLIAATMSSGLAHAIRGDIPRSVAHLERSLAIGREFGYRGFLAPVSAFLGHAYALDGRRDAASLLEDSLRIAAESHYRPCTSLWAGYLAGAYLREGRPDDALRTAEHAVQMGRDHQERGFEGMAWRELGDALAAGDRPDIARAEACYRHALMIADDLGMRPLQAHTHLSLGRLYRRAGRPHEARAELNVALDLYLSMEMRHWVPEAEAELAGLVTAPASAEKVG